MYRGENNRTRSPLLGSPSYLASLLILRRFFSGVDGFSPTCSCQTLKKIVEGSLSRNEEIPIQKFYRERIFVRVNSRAHT